MRLNPREFYDLLPRYFWSMLDGFYELENLRERQNWERTRWSTCLLLNVHLGKGKSLKPKDLIEFDWDKNTSKVDFDKLKNKAELIKKMEEYGK